MLKSWKQLDKNKYKIKQTLTRSYFQRATNSETLLGRYDHAIRAASGMQLLPGDCSKNYYHKQKQCMTNSICY